MSAVAQRLPERDLEFSFEERDHAAIARLAYDEAGIVLPPAKAGLVYGRLARRVRACGLSSFGDYIALITQDSAERERAIDALTTNHTSFFREAHHFEHFLEHPWPEMKQRLASGGRVRLWSSACSSGEEPYTWMLALLGSDRQACRQLAARDFRMLATDLSTDILAVARAGRYTRDTVRTVPNELRAAWMQLDGDKVEVRQEVRDLVSVRPLNLLKDWPIRQPFDAIFCRNVMIYFDEPTKARLLSRLADKLVPGGFLYIGHSERLTPDVAPRFKCVGRTIFQKVAA